MTTDGDRRSRAVRDDMDRTVPDGLWLLAQGDALIAAYLAALRAAGRPWDLAAALDLITHLAKRNAAVLAYAERLAMRAPAPTILACPCGGVLR